MTCVIALNSDQNSVFQEVICTQALVRVLFFVKEKPKTILIISGYTKRYTSRITNYTVGPAIIYEITPRTFTKHISTVAKSSS